MADAVPISTPSAGNVISYAARASGRARRALAPGEPRGRILLFTGIIYYHDASPGHDPAAPTHGDGSRPTRRRRG